MGSVVVVVVAVHVAEPGGAEVPGGHGMHALAPTDEKVSAGHCVHDVAPEALEYVPARQNRHGSDPVGL